MPSRGALTQITCKQPALRAKLINSKPTYVIVPFGCSAWGPAVSSFPHPT